MAISTIGNSGLNVSAITNGSATLTLPTTSGTILAQNASAPANSLVVDSSGNVGIGTGSPAYKLDVSGSINTSGSVNSVNTFGFKNRIINGGMVIDQRNAGASVTLTSGGNYVTDRFYGYENTDGTMTGQQVLKSASSGNAPTGFSSSLLFTTGTADASLAAAQYVAFGQNIEGLNVSDLDWGTANASTITLSFYVKSSLTGTFSGSLRNAAPNRSYVFTYTISAANTWEQKTITIAGDTSGTWLTTNGIGIGLLFSLGAGTQFSSSTTNAWQAGNYFSATGATSVVGTNGATFYITGVQLEKGSVATSFDQRAYSQELAMCQRYYYQTTDYIRVRCASYSVNARAFGQVIGLPIPMRTSASISLSSISYVGTGSATVEFSRSDMWGFYVISNADGSNSVSFHYSANAEL